MGQVYSAEVDMQSSTTSELEIRRYKAAVAELRAAGLFSSFDNDDGPSWSETVFQSGRQLAYLPLGQVIISQLLLCALATVLILGPVYLFNPEWAHRSLTPFITYVILIPVVAKVVAWREAQGHGLTPWEDLARQGG
jgi:hypothetical protein